VAVSNVDWTHLQGARVGLLTTYRQNGEPVATPVSVAVRAAGVYFVTVATSGKARRLTVRSDVSLAPSTVRGAVTGPVVQGHARLLDKAGRRRARRLLLPGGPLFWSYLLYRIRGHRMQVYEVTLAEPGRRPRSLTTHPDDEPGAGVSG
jgi:PPOX class probable F420-dependent enzyme